MANITIKDIARMAQVSPATVSRVINNVKYGVSDKTRLRISGIIEEYGYQPNLVARSMITKRAATIGLLVPDIANPFYALLVKGVEDVAARSGFCLVLCNSNNDDEKEYANLTCLRDNYVSGIICNNYRMGQKTQALLEEINVPIVYVDNQERVADAVSIHVRQKKGMELMTRYLLEMGHRSFAYLAGPQGVSSAKRRLEGFLDTLREAGVAVHPSFIKHCDYSESGGYAAARELCGERKDFTCLVCANDLIAYGATSLLNERGVRVPQDISITGYDDIPFSKLLNPPLTTVYNPVQEMGRRAAELVVECIRKQELHRQEEVLFDPVLIKRDSVRFLKETIAV